MRVEAPPLGGWEASKGIQNLEPDTLIKEKEKHVLINQKIARIFEKNCHEY